MIKVTDNIYIEVNTSYYTVFEKGTNKKTGKDTQVKSTYHDTLEQAYKNVVERLTKYALDTDEVIDLQQVLSIMKQMQRTFLNSWDKSDSELITGKEE